MEYERVLVIDEEVGETTYELVGRTHQPVDIDRSRRPVTSRIRIFTPTVRRARYELIPISKQSPRQDTLTPTSPGVRVPKTRGDTNEFISAYWVNGKPKCRRGYRYDFNKKICRIIK